MVNKEIKERYLNGFYLKVDDVLARSTIEFFKTREIDDEKIGCAICALIPSNLEMFSWYMQAIYEVARIRDIYPEGKIDIRGSNHSLVGIGVSDDCAIEIALANKKLKSDEFIEEVIEKYGFKFNEYNYITCEKEE